MEAIAEYMTVKITGLLKTKTFANHWCILYGGKGNFAPRLDVFVSQGTTDHAFCKKSVDIVDARWGNPDTHEPALCFFIKSKRYQLIANNEESRQLWYRYLCCLSLDLFASDQALKQSGHNGITMNDGDVVMHDNVLYASSDDVLLFDVVVDPNSEGFHRLGLKGILKLSFDSQHIKLFNLNGNTPLVSWDYYSVRSFGNSKHALNFTMGKKSPTGAGVFSFSTVEGGKMVELIASVTNKLKAQEKNGDVHPDSHDRRNVNNEVSSFQKKQLAPPVPTISVSSNLSPMSGPGRISPSPSFSSVPSHREQRPSVDISASISSKSSNGSLNRKEMKKMLKEKEKQAKQQKKEDKKLAKETKKQAKEQQKQLKLKTSEDKTRGKPPVPEKDFPVLEESVYATPDGEYADCNFTKGTSEVDGENVESEVYNEPWGKFPIPLAIPNNPNIRNVQEEEEEEDVYASPIKDRSKPSANKENVMSDSYEDVEQNPPQIPPKLAELEFDDSNNNVYDSFESNTASTQQTDLENVYGIQSAKVLFTTPKQQASSDIYETVG